MNYFVHVDITTELTIFAMAAQSIVMNYVNSLNDDHQILAASFVRELVIFRENLLELSGDDNISRKLDQLINVVCKC